MEESNICLWRKDGADEKRCEIVFLSHYSVAIEEIGDRRTLKALVLFFDSLRKDNQLVLTDVILS